jgi:hypothetical protein
MQHHFSTKALLGRVETEPTEVVPNHLGSLRYEALSIAESIRQIRVIRLIRNQTVGAHSPK